MSCQGAKSQSSDKRLFMRHMSKHLIIGRCVLIARILIDIGSATVSFHYGQYSPVITARPPLTKWINSRETHTILIYD